MCTYHIPTEEREGGACGKNINSRKITVKRMYMGIIVLLTLSLKKNKKVKSTLKKKRLNAHKQHRAHIGKQMTGPTPEIDAVGLWGSRHGPLVIPV